MVLLARRREPERQRSASQIRALTGSAQRIVLGDRQEARRLRAQRQPWQADAWAYAHNLGELRYANAYHANSAMRLRLHPATYIEGESEPVELDDESARIAGIPPDLVDAARDALARLGSGGPLAIQSIQRKLDENFQIAGECYLVGRVDPITTVEDWSIRSVSELQIGMDGRYGIREDPSQSATSRDVEWLDTNATVIRLWWPDSEFSGRADSPVRAVLDICEELLLLGKDVRATARSRLANNGILFLPDTLNVTSQNAGGQQNNPALDPFMTEMIAAATASLTDEGAASAVVPIIARGSEAAINAVKHILLQRPANAFNIQQRTELITRLATGLDLPSEVLTGKADLNHWTSWQVDDDTFRHHIEPSTIVEVDALTSGFLWTDLDTRGIWPPDLVRRVLVWYDPTPLVTHPDRTGDAMNAIGVGAIGRDALRKYLGMGADDKPDELDEILYVLEHARGVDPDILRSVLKSVAVRIKIPDAPVPTNPNPPPPSGGPAPAAGPDVPPEPGPPPGGAPQTPPPSSGGAPPPAGPGASVSNKEALTAASKPRVGRQNAALSRKLVDIDRELRAKLHTAANTAVRRTLERAGAKLVSKSRTASAAVREQIRDVPLYRIPATCGPVLTAALGLDESNLLDSAFDDFGSQYDKWVGDAQRSAVRTAAKIVGADPSDALSSAQAKLDQARADGKALLQKQLQSQTAALLASDPGPDDSGDEVDADPDRFVPKGMIRAALALAGGFALNAASSGLGDNGYPVDPSEVMGQVGTGYIVSDFLDSEGAEQAGYEWVHGPSDRPFEPHLDLDGVQFSNWDDDALANQGDFPDGDYYYCGDHDGCGCDFVVLWDASSGSDSGSESGDETGEEAA